MWFPLDRFCIKSDPSEPLFSINSRRLVFSAIFSIPNGVAFPPIEALAKVSGANSADLNLLTATTSSVSPATDAKAFSLKYSLAKSRLLITFPFFYHVLKTLKKISGFCVSKKIFT